MTHTITAIYEGGVLRPARPLALTEGTTVELTVNTPDPMPPADEIDRRISAAQSLRELFAAMDEAAQSEPDDGYDILRALNENRRRAGDVRMLTPDANEGLS